MNYTLYREIEQPQTESQIRHKAPPMFLVTKVKTVKTKEEADAWVNLDSGVRSWSYNDDME